MGPKYMTFVVLDRKWLLTTAVDSTPTGEIDEADVVAEVRDNGDHENGHGFTLKKDRGGGIRIDELMRRALSRRWNARWRPNVVPEKCATLAETARRLEHEHTIARDLLGAKPGESLLDAVNRVMFERETMRRGALRAFESSGEDAVDRVARLFYEDFRARLRELFGKAPGAKV